VYPFHSSRPFPDHHESTNGAQEEGCAFSGFTCPSAPESSAAVPRPAQATKAIGRAIDPAVGYTRAG
jgi:hypothetical protein